jgi:hypothetical protein
MRCTAAAISRAKEGPKRGGHPAGRETRTATAQEQKNYPQFGLREQFFRTTGTDLTQIAGIDALTAVTVMSEAGSDMSKWPSADHFVSWLRLSPGNRLSGDRIIGKGRLPKNNRLNVVLRMAASTLRQSNSYL